MVNEGSHEYRLDMAKLALARAAANGAGAYIDSRYVGALREELFDLQNKSESLERVCQERDTLKATLVFLSEFSLDANSREAARAALNGGSDGRVAGSGRDEQ